MRELKFRVYDKVNERYCTGIGIQGIFSSITRNNGEPSEIVLNSALSSQYDIEQYTGLKDKNGKEIYENDLIKCYTQEGYPVGKVIYSETWTEYEIVGYDKETKREYSLEHFGIATNGYLEVIGNIHENKELLNGYRED